jgi:hypothetical protein
MFAPPKPESQGLNMQNVPALTNHLSLGLAFQKTFVLPLSFWM